jgi:hypothetical protein
VTRFVPHFPFPPCRRRARGSVRSSRPERISKTMDADRNSKSGGEDRSDGVRRKRSPRGCGSHARRFFRMQPRERHPVEDRAVDTLQCDCVGGTVACGDASLERPAVGAPPGSDSGGNPKRAGLFCSARCRRDGGRGHGRNGCGHRGRGRSWSGFGVYPEAPFFRGIRGFRGLSRARRSAVLRGGRPILRDGGGDA